MDINVQNMMFLWLGELATDAISDNDNTHDGQFMITKAICI